MFQTFDKLLENSSDTFSFQMKFLMLIKSQMILFYDKSTIYMYKMLNG